MNHLFLCSLARSGTNFFLSLLDYDHSPDRFVSLGESLYNPGWVKCKELNELLNEFGEEKINSFCLLVKGDSQQPFVRNESFDLSFCIEVVRQFYEKYNQNRYVSIKWLPFGFKPFLQIIQGVSTPEEICLEDCSAQLSQYFGNITYVRLERKNKIRQAISSYVAEKTARWAIRKGQNVSPKNIQYDFKRIQVLQETFQQREMWWDTFFLENKISPIHITYEALDENYVEVLNELAQTLNVPVPVPDPDEFIYVKQTTNINDEFYERFLEDYKQLKKQEGYRN